MRFQERFSTNSRCCPGYLQAELAIRTSALLRRSPEELFASRTSQISCAVFCGAASATPRRVEGADYSFCGKRTLVETTVAVRRAAGPFSLLQPRAPFPGGLNCDFSAMFINTMPSVARDCPALRDQSCASLSWISSTVA